MENKFTPGPWRWELNENSKMVQLCGGGKTPYDLTVMDFVRYGMQDAQPRFIDGKDRDELNINVMYPATDFGAVVPGREHHKHWFKGINHPDANLIAAAPDLLKALQKAFEWAKNTINENHPDYAEITAAILKATK